MIRTIHDEELLRLRNVEKKSLAEIGKVYGISKVAVFKRLKRLEKVNGVNLIKPKIQKGANIETVSPMINARQPEKCSIQGVRATRPKYLRQVTTGRIYVYNDVYAEREDMEPFEGPLPMKG